MTAGAREDAAVAAAVASDVPARFSDAIAALGPLPRAARLVLALSGGSDSVALLSLLLGWRERERPDVGIVAGHLDHGLRGEESRGDAAFCRELCERLGVRIRLDAEPVAARAARGRLSVETAGREARLEAFRRWSEAERARAVLTAHHRDDQVETILAHIRRGAGVRGLRGIATRRPLGGGAELWRPCLSLSRAELARQRVAAGLPHREDSSNRSLGPARNRLRHQLIPLLRRDVSPAIEAALLSIGESARRIAAEDERAIAPLLPTLRARSPHAAVPPKAAAAVRGSPRRASALLDAVWSAAQGRPGALVADHHRVWGRLVEGAGDGARYDLPRGATLERAGGWLLLLGAAPPPAGTIGARPLPGRGEVAWRGATIRSGEGWADGAGLSAALPDDELEVHGARPGDRIRLGGVSHRVGELLRAAGIPARWRGSYPLIARAGGAGGKPEILWIPGVRPPSRRGGRKVRVIPEESGDPVGFLLALQRSEGGI